MKYFRRLILSLFASLGLLGYSAAAQDLNNKLMNRPYADLRPWHLGFGVGLHTQDLQFTHNGAIINGETWFVEQPGFSPGFTVNGLLDVRLNDFFNFRFTPGLSFGNRDLRMREENTGEILKQNLKTAYLMFPLDLKFGAVRYRNMRPYLIGGIMPTINLTRKNGEYIKLKPADFYLSAGFGCDFYLPYFKLIPELKFCFGLTDVLEHDRPDLDDDPTREKITQSLKKATSMMVVLTFYFE